MRVKRELYNEFITYINVEIYDVVKRAFERWLLENLSKARKEAHIANSNLFHPEYTSMILYTQLSSFFLWLANKGVLGIMSDSTNLLHPPE